MRYICSVCGYIYDEEKEKIPFAELPEDWKCPLCGAVKSDFVPEGQSAGSTASPAAPAAETDLKHLTAAEVSALCSNLAKGCEKQYRAELAEAFMVLAAWFGGRERTVTDASFEQLLERVNADLDSGFPAVNAVSRQEGDRGALRALTWSEKVTRILKSLLTRYAQEGEAMLADTQVYVCTICGFVYVGNDLPEVCPVCKVPNFKFEKIGG